LNYKDFARRLAEISHREHSVLALPNQLLIGHFAKACSIAFEIYLIGGELS
jgi:hypothetical protein